MHTQPSQLWNYATVPLALDAGLVRQSLCSSLPHPTTVLSRFAAVCGRFCHRPDHHGAQGVNPISTVCVWDDVPARALGILIRFLGLPRHNAQYDFPLLSRPGRFPQDHADQRHR